MNVLGAYLLIGLATAMSLAVMVRINHSWTEFLPSDAHWDDVVQALVFSLVVNSLIWPLVWFEVYDGGRWKG